MNDGMVPRRGDDEVMTAPEEDMRQVRRELLDMPGRADHCPGNRQGHRTSPVGPLFARNGKSDSPYVEGE